MDWALDLCDEHFFTPYVYPEWIPEDNWMRQFSSLLFMTLVGGALTYLIPATISYYTLFDHKLRQHKLFLKDQEKLEIQTALSAVPGMALPTALFFLAEVRGYSQLYDSPQEHGGYWFMAFSSLAFILFTDFSIYWIHRGLHAPSIYFLHKIHHKWKVPTPFASHAFHPLDGFAQSMPYHIYPFLFPLHKGLYLGLFMFVNIWSVLIHDNDYRVPDLFKPIVNSCAHHTDHHLFFNYNYGQYTTLWDRLGGSFRYPTGYLPGQSVHDVVARSMSENAATGKSKAA